jgi:cobalt-zinc-cadmium resistance protein CzcA
MSGLILALTGLAVRRSHLMLALLLAVLAGGVLAFLRLDIEAYPDPVPPLVDIIAQSPGESAEEVERYVTIPLEQALAGMPHLSAIRTVSLFGLADVKLQFTYDVTYEQAEQAAVSLLSQVNNLPTGVTPQVSPESPIGEIYRYRLVGPAGMKVVDLKAIQDGDLQPRFKAIPGVVDVTGWGGPTRAYNVSVDLDKLNAAGLTLSQVVQAVGNNDQNVGGRTIQFGAHAAVVRGVGLIRSLDDLRTTLLAAPGGNPVLLGDVADVTEGEQPRLGIAGQDGDDDIVEGIVLMRRGEASLPTIRRVEAEVARINDSGSLPAGVRLERIYDRSQLIALTTRTVLTNLLVGIALIFVVQWLFLGDLRSAVVVSATVPFALAFAIIVLVLRGESANLLSVGAIDFGLIVDATVILVENVVRHLREDARGAPPSRPALIMRAVGEVDRAVLFSAAIILASFIPLFTLSGIEGHIFGPMARTYAYAIVGGLIATFTVAPALASLLLPARVEERETAPMRVLRRLYEPVLEFMLANGVLALGAAFWLAVLAGGAAWSLGLEFLPHLEENNLWVRATMPQSISLEAGNALVNQMRATILHVPEVVTVVSQQGRPDDGTDATGFFNAEFYVPVKPRAEWRHEIWTKDELTSRVEDELRGAFPGVAFNFSQYIEDNVEEAASGVKGENSVKLYGSDLATLEATAVRVRDAMRTVYGITDLAIFNALGQLTLNVETDRAKAAKAGLGPTDVNAAVQAGIGGQVAGNLYDPNSARTSPIIVRLAPHDRDDVAAIQRIPLPATAPAGANGAVIPPVPLGTIANVSLSNGAAFIYRENQERYVPLKFSVRLRALGSAVREAQRQVAEQVKLPQGVRLEWVGEFRDLQDALRRLAVVVPISIALIGLLLLAQFGSAIDALLAGSVMPMALVGGLFALALTGTPFSVSAAIGFVGLFGITVMEGLVILSTFNALVDQGGEPAAALRRACAVRLRPVLMTCLAAGVGLFPAAVSRGVGAQVQGPLAVVVVGGSLMAPLLVLALLPVLIQRFSSRAATLRAALPLGEAAPPPPAN